MDLYLTNSGTEHIEEVSLTHELNGGWTEQHPYGHTISFIFATHYSMLFQIVPTPLSDLTF